MITPTTPGNARCTIHNWEGAATSSTPPAITPGGQPDTDFLQLTGGCGCVTTHPITGDGSCRAEVQEMFVKHVIANGAPGLPAVATRTKAVAHVRQRLAALGGDDQVKTTAPRP